MESGNISYWGMRDRKTKLATEQVSGREGGLLTALTGNLIWEKDRKQLDWISLTGRKTEGRNLWTLNPHSDRP